MTITRRTFGRLAGAGLALAASRRIASAAAPEPVVIRGLLSQGGLSAHELADALGYFQGTGIEIRSAGYAPGGPASLFALASNTIELGSAATAAVLNSIAGGNDFVAAYPSNGIDKTTESIFYAREGSPIRAIRDLAGKTIAVNTLGAHLDYTVREALRSAGMPPNAARLVVVPGPQLEQVLRSGQVDVSAFGYWQKTFEGAALKNGPLQKVFGDTDVLGEIAGGFVVLRRDWIEAHPGAARIFVEKSQAALDYARLHLDETKAVIAKVLAARNENAAIAQYFTGYGVRAGGKAVPRDLQFWIDVLTRNGAIRPDRLKAEDILYDPSRFAAAAN